MTAKNIPPTTELPEQFVMTVPDDALAPDLPMGASVVIERADICRPPDPGEYVLVQDADGGLYLRRFVLTDGDCFEAQSTNASHLCLNSEKDALTLLGVMAWISTRNGPAAKAARAASARTAFPQHQQPEHAP